MEPGKLLGGRYRLDQRVDGGGMGDVWRGRDTVLDRTVAIKVLHAGLSGDDTFRQRFHGEARAVAALAAPGVVNLFDYGEDTSGDTGVVSYLIMEFVPGRSLRTILTDRTRLGVAETLDIVAQSADALDAAHRAGIVHRDVKPGNILIDEENDAVKLVDFGIARTRGQSPLTETGAIMGSVSYVAPETLYGKDPTGSSDVYSLGVVAYECLAGVKPFPSDVPATVITEQLHKQPPALPDDIPPDVAAAVMRALAKQPEERWGSAADFAAACRQLRDTGQIDLPASPVADDDATVTVAADAIPTTVINRPDPADESLTIRLSTKASGPKPSAPSPRQSDEDLITHRRSGARLRVALVTAVVVGLVAAGGIAAARPWEDKNHPGSNGAGSSSQTEATSQDSSSRSQPSSASSSASESSSESSASSSAPSSSSSSAKPPTATVPKLVGLDEDSAGKKLADKGFTNASSYQVGDGDVDCGNVVEQSPAAGSTHKLDYEITYGVQYAASDADCASSTGDTSKAP
ncbi:MAG TPA: protein kinase [Stackebrandtia sp.]|uniref:protein kinase domain-containing protein n=1 Tax=Stackebrandtia sp. TaxID=2023065 RepID=UPI002D358104|nr:protein kinase [Stackebrandtia sp.]HZE39217.1 protein kinase [Stackebrandtia sp.]